MSPDVTETDINSTAGQLLSVECMFQMVNNLIRPPTVQWLNSAGSVLSDNNTLSFSPLLTSHGGVYACNVIINITELNILLTSKGITTVRVQSKMLDLHAGYYKLHYNRISVSSNTVPAPSVVIEEVGMPFNGSEYILSCIVTVDDSVDTDITISSQWLDNGGRDPATEATVSNRTESRGNREQQHNLMFTPLRNQDGGMYTCTTAISPAEKNEFIEQVTTNMTKQVTVTSK